MLQGSCCQQALRVVFASGLVITGGKWYLYYGGADTYVGLALHLGE